METQIVSVSPFFFKKNVVQQWLTEQTLPKAIGKIHLFKGVLCKQMNNGYCEARDMDY